MSILFGATQGVRAIKAEVFSIHLAKATKYHLRAGDQYLHFSGLMLTPERSQAWVGSVAQGRACRRKFVAAAGCKLRVVRVIPVHQEVEA